MVDVSGHRESEVDARNILPETSACSRAPTTPQCAAEEAIEERSTKKVEKVSQKSLQTPPILIPISTVVTSINSRRLSPLNTVRIPF
jgi:hypothetical protein